MMIATKPLRAFHGDPALQAERVARMEAHIKMDQLVQGTGFEPDTGRGCFVGCTCDRYEPGIFPEEIGYPAELQDLLDVIHEGLPPEDTPRYALAYLRDVTPGADLTRAYHEFLSWILVDGHVFPVPEAPALPAACVRVAGLHRRAAAGEAVPREEWDAARAAAGEAVPREEWDAARAAASAAAWDAASAAASAAANAATWAAARAAANAAAWAAANAAASVAANAAARAAARDAAWRAMAAKLLELMAGAPVPEEEEGP
jgi:hypothetical protein